MEILGHTVLVLRVRRYARVREQYTTATSQISQTSVSYEMLTPIFWKGDYLIIDPSARRFYSTSVGFTGPPCSACSFDSIGGYIRTHAVNVQRDRVRSGFGAGGGGGGLVVANLGTLLVYRDLSCITFTYGPRGMAYGGI